MKNQAETTRTKTVDKHSTTTVVVDATSSPQDWNQEASSNTTQEDGRQLPEDDNTKNVVESSTNSTVEAPTSKQDEQKNSEDKELFIDTIVSHKQDRRRRIRKARNDSVLYRVRWRGYAPDDDTWEPIANITRSHVIDYHERNGMAIPEVLEQSIDDSPMISDFTESDERSRCTQYHIGNRRTSDVIDSIIDDTVDDESQTRRYRVRWYADGEDDSWELMSSLPRNAIIAYHNRKQTPLPVDIDSAISG